MSEATIIYIHGFNGIGSQKGADVRESFPDYNVITPDVPLPPHEAIGLLTPLICQCTEKKEPIYLIGSSLVGWYALYLSAQYNIPIFVLNPSITPWKSLSGSVPDSFLEQWRIYSRETESKYSDALINAFLANDDERIDHTEFINRFSGIRTLKRYDGIGHRFGLREDQMRRFLPRH